MSDRRNPFDAICALFKEPPQAPEQYTAEVINLRQKRAEKLAKERQARRDLFDRTPPSAA